MKSDWNFPVAFLFYFIGIYYEDMLKNRADR